MLKSKKSKVIVGVLSIIVLGSVIWGCLSHNNAKSVESTDNTAKFIQFLGKPKQYFIDLGGGELRLAINEKSSIGYTGEKMFGTEGNVLAEFKGDSCVRATFEIVNIKKEQTKSSYEKLNKDISDMYGLESAEPILVPLRVSEKKAYKDIDFEKDILSGNYQIQHIYQENMPKGLENKAIATTCTYIPEVGTEVRVLIIDKDNMPDED